MRVLHTRYVSNVINIQGKYLTGRGIVSDLQMMAVVEDTTILEIAKRNEEFIYSDVLFVNSIIYWPCSD